MSTDNSFFEKNITIQQVVTVAFAVIATSLAFYINTEVRLKELELRISIQEQKTEQFNQKLDKVIEGQNSIMLILQNKADRKNE